MNVPLTEAANAWLNESAALRRLLSETLKEADRGGIKQAKVAMLQHTFSSSNGRQQRRDALIYILRARRRAGIEGRPEINNEWGTIELLPLIGLTIKASLRRNWCGPDPRLVNFIRTMDVRMGSWSRY